MCTVSAVNVCISSPPVTSPHRGTRFKLVRVSLTFPVCPPFLLLAGLPEVGGCDASEDRLADECKEELELFTGTTIVDTSAWRLWARPGKLLVLGLSRDNTSVDCMLRDTPAQLEPADGRTEDGARSSDASSSPNRSGSTVVGHFPVYVVVNGSAI